MPGTTSTALPSFSRDQYHERDAVKRKGRGDLGDEDVVGRLRVTTDEERVPQGGCAGKYSVEQW